MAPEDGKDLKTQADSLRRKLVHRARAARPRANVRPYYLALLLFVVLAGGLLLGVPGMRKTLAERLDTLREAHSAGETGISPLHARIGENTQPLPEEYRKPAPPVWRQAGVYMLGGRTYSAGGRIEGESPGVATEPGGSTPPAGMFESEASPSAAEPKFKQGAMELAAYNLLLQTHNTIESMVKGEVTGLRFKSWAAAGVEEQKYLVRITFTRDSETTDRDYIWSVNLATKDIAALSAYARSISP